MMLGPGGIGERVTVCICEVCGLHVFSSTLWYSEWGILESGLGFNHVNYLYVCYGVRPNPNPVFDFGHRRSVNL